MHLLFDLARSDFVVRSAVVGSNTVDFVVLRLLKQSQNSGRSSIPIHTNFSIGRESASEPRTYVLVGAPARLCQLQMYENSSEEEKHVHGNVMSSNAIIFKPSQYIHLQC